MQVDLDRFGRKVIGYGRPYIEFDEIQRNYALYDPNGPGPNYGLYDGPRPVAQRWVDYSTRYFRHQPFIPTGDRGTPFRYSGR
jgi:hypothetical protein